MRLPDLNNYRNEFLNRGVQLPLHPITLKGGGLLDALPPVANNLTGWPYTEQTSPAVYSKRVHWPKVTIVTPSYNQAQFLETTIRSVLLQNYPNLEFIIIDGGSNDDSVEIIKKYAPWLSYWHSEKDEGQGQAINRGFSIASGEYYAWINSDDYYMKDVLHLVINIFITKKVDFVYGYAYNRKMQQNELELVKMMPLIDYFIKIPCLAQPSCFWTARIHQPIWEELHCALDFELWLRLVKGHKRKQIKKPLSVAHVHDDAKTSDPKMKEKWHEDHLKIWSEEAHGTVYEWKRIVFLNRIRGKIYKILGL